MSYRVFWAPDAEQLLERFLKSSSEPALIAAAARRLDQQPAAAPLGFGESRYEAMRIGFLFPLGIQFEVMEDVRTVIVHDIWRIDRE